LKFLPQFLTPLGEYPEDGGVMDGDFVVSYLILVEVRDCFWYFPANQERSVLLNFGLVMLFFLLLLLHLFHPIPLNTLALFS